MSNSPQSFHTFQDYLRSQITDDGFDRSFTQLTTAPINQPSNLILKKQSFPTQTSTYNLLIDSRDRAADETTNSFTVRAFEGNTSDDGVAMSLDFRYKNVKKITFWEAVLPDFTDTLPYVLIEIPQWKDVMSGTNDALRNSFAVLIPERVNGRFVTCKHIYEDQVCGKMFDPPLASLGNFEIRILDPDGQPHQFELDEEILLVFKVCCVEPDTTKLDYTIV